MHMSYGDFCALFRIKPSPDALRFWLLSHLLPPHLEAAVIAKTRARRDEQPVKP